MSPLHRSLIMHLPSTLTALAISFAAFHGAVAIPAPGGDGGGEAAPPMPSTVPVVPRQSNPAPLTAADRAALASRFAPIVYIHRYDANRPADPAAVWSQSSINTAGNFVDIPAGLAVGDSPNGNRQYTTPASFQVVQDGPHNLTYLQFWTYFNVNGCQGFRIGTWTGFFKKAEQEFNWCNLAKHNGDWEHLTIQLNGLVSSGDDLSKYTIRNICYSQHSECVWTNSPPLSGTHPISYAAMSSHANYPVQQNVWNHDSTFDNYVSKALPVITAGTVRYINLVDILEETNLHTYDSSVVVPGSGPVKWDLSTTANHDLSDPAARPAWATFSGFWGGKLDQGDLSKPPSGVQDQSYLYDLIKAAKAAGAINGYTSVTDGTAGPLSHGSWTDFDAPPA
ncbi:hypothetical protein HK101_002501 [Irineochytrium annulatum]|nr:hypothetical protein HK101_002501 [Irineochytrium annulatum]